MLYLRLELDADITFKFILAPTSVITHSSQDIVWQSFFQLTPPFLEGEQANLLPLDSGSSGRVAIRAQSLHDLYTHTDDGIAGKLKYSI